MRDTVLLRTLARTPPAPGSLVLMTLVPCTSLEGVTISGEGMQMCSPSSDLLEPACSSTWMSFSKSTDTESGASIGTSIDVVGAYNNCAVYKVIGAKGVVLWSRRLVS